MQAIYSIFTIVAILAATEAVPESAQERKICRSLNGTIKDFYTRETAPPYDSGLTFPVCMIDLVNEDGRLSSANVDPRVWTHKTIAGSLMKHAKPYDLKAIPFDGEVIACEILGGTATTLFDFNLKTTDKPGNEYNICFFGDGSFISYWTLIYTSQSHFTAFDSAKYRHIKDSPIQAFGDVQPLETYKGKYIFYNVTDKSCKKDSDCKHTRVCGRFLASKCSKGQCTVPNENKGHCDLDHTPATCPQETPTTDILGNTYCIADPKIQTCSRKDNTCATMFDAGTYRRE
eukprot:CAMPEP_0203785052 /NCGR_PEP_ID=MMETSP0100_2-20121128/810_1 /ASSEMBLY_ACC=CAM_ASM_000210 /TAXON_ID=96639 /ORGANISM=" , Strain NY0313808BC1" /LENGTH=287 /DNA_ID=CAMNT_0050687107 /DNA_START=6 /DNA_END=869 /DNA_ORIENTATION=+